MEATPGHRKPRPRLTTVTVHLPAEEIARLDAVKREAPTRWGLTLRSRAEALRLLLHLGSDRLFKKPNETGGAV